MSNFWCIISTSKINFNEVLVQVRSWETRDAGRRPESIAADQKLLAVTPWFSEPEQARLGRDRTLGGSVRQETACFEICCNSSVDPRTMTVAMLKREVIMTKRGGGAKLVILRQSRELGDPSAKASIRSELSLTHILRTCRTCTRGDVNTCMLLP